MKYIAMIDDQKFTIDITRQGEITLDGEAINASLKQSLDQTIYSIIVDNQSYDVRIYPGEDFYTVEVGGEIYEITVEDERTHRLAGLKSSLGAMTGEYVLKAPMPGVVVDVPVTEGQEVTKGKTVVVLESMKMQNELKSPRDGKIHAVRVAKGDRVELNAIMVTIT
jgi:acetyl/propionyl-CoA carboxylase alpha subunit